MTHLNRPIYCSFLVLDERHERYRALQFGWVIGGFNGASAQNVLQPLCTKDVSESYESLIL